MDQQVSDPDYPPIDYSVRAKKYEAIAICSLPDCTIFESATAGTKDEARRIVEARIKKSIDAWRYRNPPKRPISEGPCKGRCQYEGKPYFCVANNVPCEEYTT
jgi:hypothetical protein